MTPLGLVCPLPIDWWRTRQYFIQDSNPVVDVRAVALLNTGMRYSLGRVKLGASVGMRGHRWI